MSDADKLESIDKTPKQKRNCNSRIRIFKCDVCHKILSDNRTLMRHLLIHTEAITGQPRERPFACSVCGKCFAEKSTLKTHEIGHVAKPKKCDLCDKLFYNKGTLKRHFLSIHVGEKNYICGQCNKSFFRLYHLQNHELTHIDEKLFSCEVCHKKFSTKSTLKNHQWLHKEQKPFACDVCKRGFADSRGLLVHKYTHVKDKPHKCDMCDKSFIRMDQLKSHEKTHIEGEPFECEKCGRKFTLKKSFQDHCEYHLGYKPHTCDICQEHFTTRYSLNRHRNTQHQNVNSPHNCDICNEAFNDESKLLDHVMNHDNVKKEFSCNICNDSFSSADLLKSHSITHKNNSLVCKKKKYINRNEDISSDSLQGVKNNAIQVGKQHFEDFLDDKINISVGESLLSPYANLNNIDKSKNVHVKKVSLKIFSSKSASRLNEGNLNDSEEDNFSNLKPLEGASNKTNDSDTVESSEVKPSVHYIVIKREEV